ncbi:MAG: hypothetical protein Q8K38_01575 [Burkholderiaceae bacterium]|nr:hypothetical protein [Burkholderiaceae bacterium]MDZ4145116.1 hypothetical protein [Burkholderiales bacterium]
MVRLSGTDILSSDPRQEVAAWTDFSAAETGCIIWLPITVHMKEVSMNTHTAFTTPQAPNPFAMLFPEQRDRIAACAAASSMPSRHYRPLDKPTPKSVRTAQMQAADLLIDAMAEVEDGATAQAAEPVCPTPQAAPVARPGRMVHRPSSLSRSELVRAVLA